MLNSTRGKDYFAIVRPRSRNSSVVILFILFVQFVNAQNAKNSTDLEKQAQAGDAHAQVRLGLAYANGQGVPFDEATAVEWFQKAADQGDAAGAYSLSKMYSTGHGVMPDQDKALVWLQRSAENGDARGQLDLAAHYLSGIGVPQDELKAAILMRKAADQGLAAAEVNLGIMYAHGKGVPQNDVDAVEWYRKAVKQGNAVAMNNLAFLLVTSHSNTLRNPHEAILLIKQAVKLESDNPIFQDTLAASYAALGQFGDAVDAETNAVRLWPNKPSYLEALKKYKAAAAPHGVE